MINRSLTNMPALNTNDMLYNRFYTGRAEGRCIHHPWVNYGNIQPLYPSKRLLARVLYTQLIQPRELSSEKMSHAP